MKNGNPGSLQLQNTVVLLHTINFSVSTLYKYNIYIYINLYRVNMDGLVWHHEMHLDSLDDAGC